MKKPLISLILPVYKVEDYIKECIDSILCQDFKDFEIILVDDGSPDNCPAICDEYAKKDSRVKVLHKKNAGVSLARNDGVKISNGDYIWFVDSDDHIAEDALSQIANALNESGEVDVVFINTYRLYVNTGEIEYFDYKFSELDRKTATGKDVLKHFAKHKHGGFPWYKILNRKFLIENELYFLNGIVFAEDLEWTIRILQNINTFTYCDKGLYYYKMGREGSAIGMNNGKRVACIIKICELFEDNEDQYVRSILGRLYFLGILAYTRLLTKQERKEHKKNLKKFLYLLDYCKDSTVNKYIVMYGKMGFSLGYHLYQALIKFKLVSRD